VDIVLKSLGSLGTFGIMTAVVGAPLRGSVTVADSIADGPEDVELGVNDLQEYKRSNL